MQIAITVQDITKFEADAIVNAANTTLLGGGGVDGAIHRVAGRELFAACAKLGGCKTGEAKITPGFKLPAKFVIHTPGPIYALNRKERSDELLRNCYVNSLKLAEENDCKTIGFASISTGVYRFPLQRAAEIVAKVFCEFNEQGSSIERATMVCFDERTAQAYRATLSALKNYVEE